MAFNNTLKYFSLKKADTLNEDEKQSLEYVIEYVSKLVRGGYDSREDIIYYVKDAIASEGVKNVKAKKLVNNTIKALIEEQASWPAETSYQKLSKAMKELEAEGIIARENFSCCMNCGNAEIGDEITDFEKSGKSAKGYVFFHEQATEHATEGYEINFVYGCYPFELPEEEHVKIGQILADKMIEAGFKVDWNGSLSKCVMVDVKWQRRWRET